jgi:hypothetical protein
MSLSAASVIDRAIELEIGAAGVGGNANTTAGDGYCELDVPLGSTTYEHHLYRRLGDVAGDAVVHNSDPTAIATELARSSPMSFIPFGKNVNGDGSVTSFDITLATRAKGRARRSGLSLG